MSTTAANNKRIAKNTLFLYFRMLLTMGVTLYTSRVVLSILGIEDFGIYNVVGGVVSMFSFLNAAMSSSTQRFLTYELGKGNSAEVSKVFSTSLQIHFIIALGILLLAETVGLWFLEYKMVIPEERMTAARWVYQFSILGSLVGVVSIPYNALIIAHEKMSAFAYISIIEVILKLAVVFVLLLGNFDRLILYAILIFAVQLFIRIIYGSYCRKKFNDIRFKMQFERNLFKKMFSFAGWSLFGNAAAILFSQGLNILLNLFFGPVVNAARGIAVQVQSAVSLFAANFQTAVNPQIIKSYAENNLSNMHNLIFKSAKYSFFLLFLLSLPIFIETEQILSWWLKEVPQNTAVFLRIILCTTIIDAVANPFMRSADATGKIKIYHSILGGLLLLIVPISYIVLKLGAPAYSVFIVHLCLCIIVFIVRLLIIRPMIKLCISEYMSKVIFRIFIVAFLSTIIPLILHFILSPTMINAILICCICILSVALSIWLVGLSSSEKKILKGQIVKIYYKIGRKSDVEK